MQTIFDGDKNSRIDVFISEFLEISRTRSTELISAGLVFVNDKQVQKSYKLQNGDRILVNETEVKKYEVKNVGTFRLESPIEVIYEDEDLIVVNKPKGLCVHPSAGYEFQNSLIGILSSKGVKLSSIGGTSPEGIRSGVVHRIDKDTSGLLVLAKTDSAHEFLSKQLKEYKAKRVYEAILCGELGGGKFPVRGTVNAAIGRDERNRLKKKAYPKTYIASQKIREAITRVELIENICGYSHAKFTLETGRTHQIRAHCEFIGLPILGDLLYGGKEIAGYRGMGQCLHAKKLAFLHPRTGEFMIFDSESPEYFKSVLKGIR